MQENGPCLVSIKILKQDFEKLRCIKLNSKKFTLGRSLANNIVIPYIAISRNHCIFHNDENGWSVEDCSAAGIEINGQKLGKGVKKKLENEDRIKLDPLEEFVYKFVYNFENTDDEFEIPKKRIRMETFHNVDIINDMKIKFQESQHFEMKHIEEKIESAKQMQTTSKILKEQLHLEMNRKVEQLEKKFQCQIENLKGEKNEVEKQKASLIEERDAQLSVVKKAMEGEIAELMEQIKKHNETESELMNENNLLKEKLEKDKEEFLSELNRESSSKQEMLERLEAKIREQEEIRLKEKQELEDMLRKETEQLRIAKEKELAELEEQKRLKELELTEELNSMKKSLEEKIEQQRIKAEQQLNEHVERMKKLSDEDKIKMDQLMMERQQIEKQLSEAQVNAEKSLEELRNKVQQRETELAALAADRIQKQAEQSTEVITSLQEQLENVRNQLESVKEEKNTLLESLCLTGTVSEGTSKQATLAEVGELMENELQCSVCAEMFIYPITLNCSHTFCKYCIAMWKKKKRDCPNCRAPILSECRSLALESFIEKASRAMSEEMQQKRQELLTAREELESANCNGGSSCRGGATVRTASSSARWADSQSETSSGTETNSTETDVFDDDGVCSDDYGSIGGPGFEHDYFYDEGDSYSSGWSDTDSGSDDAAGDSAAAAASYLPSGAGDRPDNNASPADRRRRGWVEGLPGHYYGGYGRCFKCGARGHWAPGCPFRRQHYGRGSHPSSVSTVRPNQPTVSSHVRDLDQPRRTHTSNTVGRCRPVNTLQSSTHGSNQSTASTERPNEPTVSTARTNQPTASTERTNPPTVSTARTNQPTVSTARTNQPTVSTARHNHVHS